MSRPREPRYARRTSTHEAVRTQSREILDWVSRWLGLLCATRPRIGSPRQQRVTTLNQYFTGAPDLRLPATLKPYSGLSKAEKEQFLQYDVVVRDLGKLSIEDIREVFRRINATRYSLNAMEIHNARHAGQYKEFAEALAQELFFEKHRIFSPADIRRMLDTLFVLQVVTTVLSSYFNRDSEIEDYLQQYNDEFPAATNIESEMKAVFTLIDEMDLPSDSRRPYRAAPSR